MFRIVSNIARNVDKSFPSGTKRGEIVRLVRLSLLIARNEGLFVLFRSFKEKLQKQMLPQRLKFASGVRTIPKPYLPTTEFSSSSNSNIIYNTGLRTVDNQLRKDMQIGSADLLQLLRYPKVSIIIPTYSQVGFLQKALKSIESKTTYKNYEIILVTNNLDENSDMRKFLKTVKYPVHLFTEKYCWGARNNFAATKANGEFLLLLNDDVEIVSPNWLEAFLRLALDDRVGAVGPKILFPDGKLQEAGCIIWKNGNGWNYGRNENPDDPNFNFVREVDYCSACCLLIKKQAFDKVGGFDLRYEIGYAEDCDLCFSMSQAGYKILYQPYASIIHYEGRTQGTDVQGASNKAYQIQNVKRFTEKWKPLLESRNPDSIENTFLERNRKNGANILFVDHYVPEYDKDAGSLRTYYMVSVLSSLGHKVTFWPDNLNKTEPYASELQQKGIEVMYAPNNFESFIKERGFSFHICIASRPHISIKYIDLIRKHAPKCKIVYDPIDISFVREFREAEFKKNPIMLEQASRTKENELQLIRKCDMTMLTSEKESLLLLQEDSSISTAVISVFQLPENEIPEYHERKDLLFLGGFQHPPNVDSIEYMVRDVFPKIKKKISDIKLYVIGSNPPSKVVELCSKTDGIVFLGYVKNIDPYLKKCRVMVAPLRFGAGVKGKITQSMANGLPVVTTSIGAEGISIGNKRVLLVGDDVDTFVSESMELYQNERLWSEISTNAVEHINMYFSPELARDTLTQLISKCIDS